ncbi:MAG: CehA/McbA family metallohydrolase [Planctomycetaceae bacterium]|nr:CehA/McbA family metallohydrolase [Planctomycetaceae bacterium]
MSRFALVCCLIQMTSSLSATEFQGVIDDAETGRPLVARVYLIDEMGQELFVESAGENGSAIVYQEQWVPMPGISEKHTTVSAHPFRADLKPGTYRLIVEKGKEYFPAEIMLTIEEKPVEQTIRLKRWINLAERGWYCGETHIHRRFEELPLLMQAEGLNVGFPVSYWTTSSVEAPSLNPAILQRGNRSRFGPRQDHGAEPVWIDRDHVILPRNTEYEIFNIGEKRHTQGAIFLLNHQSVFTDKAPPIADIARQAHEEGALLDLDKHSWPWSMMLVPVAKIDLFELSNNHVWRTKFGFKSQQIMPADWMNVEMESPGQMTEWGWLNYGWEVYYTLLNCGFHIAPTAGTASGVHPVPLGYSRVYVHTGEQLSVDSFMDGLQQGRSFVTTGPMLFVTVENTQSGTVLKSEKQKKQTFEIDVQSLSQRQSVTMQVIVNGQVVETIDPHPIQTDDGAWKIDATTTVTLDDSGWIAVRSIGKQPDGRKRFAHTAPWYVEMAGRPVTPRQEQIEWLIELMEEQIERNRDVLSPEALAEFEQALKAYQKIQERVVGK